MKNKRHSKSPSEVCSQKSTQTTCEKRETVVIKSDKFQIRSKSPQQSPGASGASASENEERFLSESSTKHSSTTSNRTKKNLEIDISFDVPELNPFNVICVISIIVAIISIIWFIVPTFIGTSSPNGSICHSFNRLLNLVQTDDTKVIRALQVSINETLEKNTPSVFLFASHRDNDEFMKEVINVTLSCFGSKSHIALNEQNFTEAVEYGVIVQLCKKLLPDKVVLHVQDLEKISGSKAQALHAICDTMNPMVPRSIIFLTMKLPSPPDPGTNHELVENLLRSRWHDLGDAILEPLLSRITDQTFLLQ